MSEKMEICDHKPHIPITEDNIFWTLRGMINRGYCDIPGICARSSASKEKLTPEIVEECLRQAIPKNLVWKHPFAYPEAFIITPWGQKALDLDSLRKLAELSREGMEPLWD